MDRNLIPRSDGALPSVINSSSTAAEENLSPPVGGSNEYDPTDVDLGSSVLTPHTIRLSERRPLRDFDRYPPPNSVPIFNSTQPAFEEEGNSGSDIDREPPASPATLGWTTTPRYGNYGVFELGTRQRTPEIVRFPPPVATPLSGYIGDVRQAEPPAATPGSNTSPYGRQERFEGTRTIPTPPASPSADGAPDTREAQAIEAHRLGSLPSDEFAEGSRSGAGEIRRSPTRRAIRNNSRRDIEIAFFFAGLHTFEESVGMSAVFAYLNRPAPRARHREERDTEDFDPVPPYTRRSSRTIGQVGDYDMGNTDGAINSDAERLIEDNVFRSMATGQNSGLADQLEEMRIQDSEDPPVYREPGAQIEASHGRPHRLNEWLTRWAMERTSVREASMELADEEEEEEDGSEDSVHFTQEWMTPWLLSYE